LEGKYSILSRRRDFFLSAVASRPVLGPTQPHKQWIAEALSEELKRSEHEGDHLHMYNAKVNNVRQLVKHRDIFTITR
jgi:hypothetical protein